MFTDDYRIILGILGISLIYIPVIISKFTDIKVFGCIIPFVGISILLIVIFLFKEITIIKNNKIIIHRNTLFSSLDFKYHNGITKEILIEDDVVLVNDSDQNLILENVKYQNLHEIDDDLDTTSKIIPPNSYSKIHTVDYYFEEPPITIYQESSDRKVKYWLHY